MWAIAVGLVLALVGSCLTTGPPTDRGLTAIQLKAVNQMVDGLHEEVAAARAPSHWPFALFLLSILAPLAAGIWLVWQAQRSIIGHDETIRWMVRAGHGERVIRSYLASASSSPRLTASAMLRRGNALSPRPGNSARLRRFWGRWRPRQNTEKDEDVPLSVPRLDSPNAS